jgi:hypothetical protein
MTFDQWWNLLTTREQNMIGKNNAKFVWEEAAAAEREACAKKCDDAAHLWWSKASSVDREIEPVVGISAVQAATRIRDAILRRGEK